MYSRQQERCSFLTIWDFTAGTLSIKRKFWRKMIINKEIGLKHQPYLQVRRETFICVDDWICHHFFIWRGLPKSCQLCSHVAPLVVGMFVAWGHLLNCVHIHINVSGRVRSVHHLAEWQHKASSWILKNWQHLNTVHSQSPKKNSTANSTMDRKMW